jgi:hypothetical protein
LLPQQRSYPCGHQGPHTSPIDPLSTSLQEAAPEQPRTASVLHSTRRLKLVSGDHVVQAIMWSSRATNTVLLERRSWRYLNGRRDHVRAMPPPKRRRMLGG